VDGQKVEGTFRSHQVPLSEPGKNPEHLKQLEQWLKSYRPEELFDENGRLFPEIKELAPAGLRRMGSNPHANGGRSLRRCSTLPRPQRGASASPVQTFRREGTLAYIRRPTPPIDLSAQTPAASCDRA
jgi:phosphoketolase